MADTLNDAGEKIALMMIAAIILLLLLYLCNVISAPPACGPGAFECESCDPTISNPNDPNYCSAGKSPCGCCSVSNPTESFCPCGVNAHTCPICDIGETNPESPNYCQPGRSPCGCCADNGETPVCPETGQCPNGPGTENRYCGDDAPENPDCSSWPDGCCPVGTYWDNGQSCCFNPVLQQCECPPNKRCPLQYNHCRNYWSSGCCGQGLEFDPIQKCCIDPETGQCVECPPPTVWNQEKKCCWYDPPPPGGDDGQCMACDASHWIMYIDENGNMHYCCSTKCPGKCDMDCPQGYVQSCNADCCVLPGQTECCPNWSQQKKCCADSCGNCIMQCPGGKEWTCYGNCEYCGCCGPPQTCPPGETWQCDSQTECTNCGCRKACISDPTRDACSMGAQGCDSQGCCWDHSEWDEAQSCCAINGVCLPNCENWCCHDDDKRCVPEDECPASGVCCTSDGETCDCPGCPPPLVCCPDGRHSCPSGCCNPDGTCGSGCVQDPCWYDLNQDGKLSQLDINAFNQVLAAHQSQPGWYEAGYDFNRDGTVDVKDRECIEEMCGGNWECVISSGCEDVINARSCKLGWYTLSQQTQTYQFQEYVTSLMVRCGSTQAFAAQCYSDTGAVVRCPRITWQVGELGRGYFSPSATDSNLYPSSVYSAPNSNCEGNVVVTANATNPEGQLFKCQKTIQLMQELWIPDIPFNPFIPNFP